MPAKPVSAGTAFEKSIRQTCDAYYSAGIAYLEKVAPPVLVLRPPGRLPVIRLLENPFLDFVGTWTARDGKLLMIECKYTTGDTLSIGAESGIKLKQLEACEKWERAGAATAILWRSAAGGHDTRILTPDMVRAQLTRRKSFRWCDAHAVPQGRGFILIDFLAILGRLHKPQNQTENVT